ncbi:hypothetical protein FA95DRAFT_1613271 [Auriscalpium vulgare]|uniref:Uncharacterized protein n=1 Tax=Auriscalpium vulgare TaxID=40419 RepID=A0ACB8R3A8_9AGAM|nr:hypothetical protein FA95DRAFT_1613271 [Auriscalpium vulgare]
MATIFFDVQVMIIDWVYRSSQQHSIDYETLHACALVCQSWTPVAQRLLFRRISVFLLQYFKHGAESIVLLLRTLRAAPHLAAHIRSITLDVKPFHRNPAFDNNTISLLELCTNIDGIELEPDIGFNAGQDTFVARLLAVPVHPVFLRVSGDAALVDSVINNWPSVRVIQVRIWPTNEAMRIPSSLHALTAPVSQRWKTPRAMLPALRALELLDIKWTDTAQCTALVAPGVLPQLRTLSVLGGPYAPPREFTDALAGLETLILSTLPEKACVLPPGLWHLGYHSHDLGRTDQVAGAQLLLNAARALPNLRLVTVTRQSSVEVLEAFEGVCLDCGVDFAVYERPECFPLPRHVDWI